MSHNVDFHACYGPGGVKLVDHALSRVARKGALAVIDVSGEENHEVFDPEPDA